jgi:hypothetical protein
MIDEKSLNEKLAKWLGFKKIEPPEWDYRNINPKTLRWIDPTGRKLSLLLPLVVSLNAQVKWLYPKLKCITKTNNFKGWLVSLNMGTGKIPSYIGEDENEAIAFALACEKYIDSLDDKNE